MPQMGLNLLVMISFSAIFFFCFKQKCNKSLLKVKNDMKFFILHTFEFRENDSMNNIRFKNIQ